MEAVTDIMETAASTADLSTARQSLLHSVERLTESLAAPAPVDGCPDTGTTENIKPKMPWTGGDKLHSISRLL